MTINYSALREQVLVSTEWLATHLDDHSMRIVDMRKGDGFETSHIPNAVAHGGSPFLREDGDVISSAAFAAMMIRWGVDDDTCIVAYDDGNGLFAARLWWVARYYGHHRIKVLDGGWDLWLAEGRQTRIGDGATAPGAFVSRPQLQLIASTDYVRSVLRNPQVTLLDVRGDEEWSRARSDGSSVAGHVPGAHHFVWSRVIDSASKRYLDGDILRQMFLEAGVAPGREVVPYCQGGIRAAHTMLALRLAGLELARNYEGSWAAWIKSGFEIELHGALRFGDQP